MREQDEKVALSVNGASLEVPQGTTVAAAVLLAGAVARISVAGEVRAPLCGMGTCFECRVTIDGVPHQRSCQILCRPGMQIAAPAPDANQTTEGGRTA